MTWVVEPKLTKSTEVQINSPVNESPLGIHQVKLVVKSEMIEVGYQMIFEFKKRIKYLNLLNHLEHFRPQDSIKHINQKVRTLVPPCPSLHDRRGVGETANRPGGNLLRSVPHIYFGLKIKSYQYLGHYRRFRFIHGSY